MLSINVYIKVLLPSNYIWIIYLLTIYRNNSETGILILFNKTHFKNAVFGPLRLQELEYHISKSIDAE